MKSGFPHKILIVDDEPPIIKAVARILHPLDIRLTPAPDGEAALEIIRASPTPFSVIISDQRMPGMMGTRLLGEAKTLSPKTVRILMTGYSRMDTIIDAINKGAVHRYITKPWDAEALLSTVRQGLEKFEVHLNLENLMATAKKQNAKLYALNRELMKKNKADHQILAELNREIAEMASRQESRGASFSFAPERIVKAITEDSASADNQQACLDHMYTTTVRRLAQELEDLALRNGFEMPMPDNWGAHDG